MEPLPLSRRALLRALPDDVLSRLQDHLPVDALARLGAASTAQREAQRAARELLGAARFCVLAASRLLASSDGSDDVEGGGEGGGAAWRSLVQEAPSRLVQRLVLERMLGLLLDLYRRARRPLAGNVGAHFILYLLGGESFEMIVSDEPDSFGSPARRRLSFVHRRCGGERRELEAQRGSLPPFTWEVGVDAYGSTTTITVHQAPDASNTLLAYWTKIISALPARERLLRSIGGVSPDLSMGLLRACRLLYVYGAVPPDAVSGLGRLGFETLRAMDGLTIFEGEDRGAELLAS